MCGECWELLKKNYMIYESVNSWTDRSKNYCVMWIEIEVSLNHVKSSAWSSSWWHVNFSLKSLDSRSIAHDSRRYWVKLTKTIKIYKNVIIDENFSRWLITISSNWMENHSSLQFFSSSVCRLSSSSRARNFRRCWVEVFETPWNEGDRKEIKTISLSLTVVLVIEKW